MYSFNVISYFISFKMSNKYYRDSYASMDEFYPFYLSQHSSRLNRKLHFIGTTLGFLIILTALITGYYSYLILFPIVGYGFAWIGHFFIEKNRPATFKYPLFSFIGDMYMYKAIIQGKEDELYKSLGITQSE